MRTTLDIDDDVLQAAKELAQAERKTAGKVLSDLARKGLVGPEGFSETPGANRPVPEDGWYTLPRRGVIVTKELVDQLIEEADLDEGRLSLGKE